jgi:hypothetical protein
MTSNELHKLINDDNGKQALDQMLDEGMSADEIRNLYDSINFYPNSETLNYIYARKNKEALDGFFSKVNI